MLEAMPTRSQQDRFSAPCYQIAVGSFTQRRAKSQVPRGNVGDELHGNRATNPVSRSCSLGGCHQSLIDRQRLALLGTLVGSAGCAQEVNICMRWLSSSRPTAGSSGWACAIV